MAIGNNGRVVIDLDTHKKRAIYAAFKKEGHDEARMVPGKGRSRTYLLAE
jgi:hypothetical protein